jgi:RNA polymerase sigma factor (sigma-70 family)
LSPVRSHIDEKDFAGFLVKLRDGNERSWYHLDFVLKRIVCKWLCQKRIPLDDSIEIYNSVFSIFYEKIQQTDFENFRKLKSYVFSIAEYKVKEFYREKVNRRRNESIEDEHYSRYIIAVSNTKQAEIEEQIDQVMACFEQLNEKERTVLSLVYKEGKLLWEVAQILAIGEGNVRVIKHRALAKIRKRLSANNNKSLT